LPAGLGDITLVPPMISTRHPSGTGRLSAIFRTSVMSCSGTVAVMLTSRLSSIIGDPPWHDRGPRAPANQMLPG
jgi:hypothetical protein